MKARATLLAISLTMGMAVAQESSSQASPAQTDPQKQADTQSKTKSQTTEQANPADTSKDKAAEMKTMNYSGVLVDLSCSGSTNTAATQPDAAATAQPAQPGQPAQPAQAQPAAGGASSANSANRSAGDSQGCPATASSTQLGLKMDDGKVVRFDLVGNQRAVDELKNNKKWNKEVSANKPLKVKISGVLNGDKLIVSSIH
jgi:hypothetical protein